MRIDDAGPRTWLLAALAGWALLAWALAMFGMGRQVAPLPQDPAALRPLPALPGEPAGQLGPATQYDQLAARPLFASDRQPRPFVIAGQEADAGASAFDYVLTSVLITPGLRMAILQPADGSDPVRVRVDEAPEAHPAWRLSAVDERSAVFDGPEGQRTLELRVFDGQGGLAPTAVSTETASQPRRPPLPVAPPRPGTAPAPAGTPSPAPVPAPTQVPSVPPEEPSQSEAGPMTNEAQMEAIRKRIEARRAQLRQQASPPTPPTQPPAQSP